MCHMLKYRQRVIIYIARCFVVAGPVAQVELEQSVKHSKQCGVEQIVSDSRHYCVLLCLLLLRIAR